MASNLQLTELEQRVLDYVKWNPDSSELDILVNNRGVPNAKVRQAIASLLSNSFISADEDLRYVAVGGEL